MADITIVNGVYKPTYNWGAPSCIPLKLFRSIGFRFLSKAPLGRLIGGQLIT
jgi:hypothetical protein